jgi:hypothetical protein
VAGNVQKKKIPKHMKVSLEEYCHELWMNRSGLNVAELFKVSVTLLHLLAHTKSSNKYEARHNCVQDVPPTMRINLTNYLYGPTISRNPLFRGLSAEVINALCNRAQAMYMMPKQPVFKEDEPGSEMYLSQSEYILSTVQWIGLSIHSNES